MKQTVICIGMIICLLMGCSSSSDIEHNEYLADIEETQDQAAIVLDVENVDEDIEEEEEDIQEEVQDNTDELIKKIEELEAEISEYEVELSELQKTEPIEYIATTCPDCNGTLLVECRLCKGTGTYLNDQCYYCVAVTGVAGYEFCTKCRYARSYNLDLEEGQVATENPSYASDYATYISKVEAIQEKIEDRQNMIDEYMYEITGEEQEETSSYAGTDNGDAAESNSSSYVPSTDSTLTKTAVTCVLCNGLGKEVCDSCHGTGELAFDSTTLTSNTCRACNGSGYMSCWKCNGQGHTYEYN